jgi:peptide/nickel transport system permease protein
MFTRLILSRLIGALLTLAAVATLVFWSFELLPGDVAARVLGRFSTQAARQAFREELGLNRPALTRYAEWLSASLRGDLGASYASRRPVSEVVRPKLHNTLLLGAYALALYVPVTLGAAALAALNRDRLLDNLTSIAVLVGISVPDFVLGTLLIIGLAVYLPWFPSISVIERANSFWEVVHLLALPAVTLTALMAAYAIRMLRDNLIEVLDSDYIRMAALKGLPRWQILVQHALPNALLPVLNVTALNLTYLIGGVVIVEYVFAFDGLGTLLVDSIFSYDVPIIQAIVLIVSAVYILGNLLADLMGILLNPRLRPG